MTARKPPKTLVRLAVAGTRQWTHEGAEADVARIIELACEKMRWTPDMIISGHCEGVDICGEEWGEARTMPIARLPALWNEFGSPKAAHDRNEAIAILCHAAVVIPHPDGRGTQDLMRRLRAHGKTYVVCCAVTGKMAVEGVRR